MIRTVEQLETEVMDLPVAERARLAERLIASLDEDADLERAWSEEIQRRLADYDSGRAKAMPAVEVFAEARNRLK